MITLDINECNTTATNVNYVCGGEKDKEWGECTNTEGSYICNCNDGFENTNSSQYDCVSKCYAITAIIEGTTTLALHAGVNLCGIYVGYRSKLLENLVITKKGY